MQSLCWVCRYLIYVNQNTNIIFKKLFILYMCFFFKVTCWRFSTCNCWLNWACNCWSIWVCSCWLIWASERGASMLEYAERMRLLLLLFNQNLMLLDQINIKMHIACQHHQIICDIHLNHFLFNGRLNVISSCLFYK